MRRDSNRLSWHFGQVVSFKSGLAVTQRAGPPWCTTCPFFMSDRQRQNISKAPSQMQPQTLETQPKELRQQEPEKTAANNNDNSELDVIIFESSTSIRTKIPRTGHAKNFNRRHNKTYHQASPKTRLQLVVSFMAAELRTQPPRIPLHRHCNQRESQKSTPN